MKHLACGFAGLLLLFSCGASIASNTPTIVPLGGNAYVTRHSPTNDEAIGDAGLGNWDSKQAVVSVYFDVKKPGQLQLALVGSLNGASHSQVIVSIGKQAKLVQLSSTSPGPFPAGTFLVDKPGYVKVDLQGLYTDGGYFGDISGLQIRGSAFDGGTVFANDPANFYWSRRGPSVHLGFAVPANTEYFYSEVTVPKGQDPVGSYYMANGFNTGYMGIQVNSPTERWVLFSVWDSPAGPTSLVRKGPNVIANDFGGEGTGGQSHLVFNWKAGKTYRFLTQAQPDGSGNTVYTSWFSARCIGEGDDSCKWQLIASWKYQGTSTYLKGVYSFLESFDADHGYIGRSALYGNEWAVTSDGKWNEVKSAYFDVDPTGLNAQRLDFGGGAIGPVFYLRNDGFFSNSTTSGQTFTRTSSWIHPDVDLSKLP
jgi:hypothetical protein